METTKSGWLRVDYVHSKSCADPRSSRYGMSTELVEPILLLVSREDLSGLASSEQARAKWRKITIALWCFGFGYNFGGCYLWV